MRHGQALGAIEQLIIQRRFKDAAAECERVLSRNITPLERCRTLQLLAQALLSTGETWEGKAAGHLKDALSLAEEGTDEWGRVLASLTAAYAALGHWSSCREYHAKFLAFYKSNPSGALANFYPDVEFNLALAYHHAEKLDEAETAYMVALKAAQGSADDYVRSLIPLIYHNLADVFQELGRDEEAFRLVKEADMPDDFYGAQVRSRKARYALYCGDLQSALLWVESGLGHPALDVRTRSALYLTKAKIFKATGQLGDAYQWAQEAKRVAADSPVICESDRAPYVFSRNWSKG